MNERSGVVAPGERRLLLLAEATLLGVTAAAVLGMARLFDNGSFLAPVLAAAVAGHVAAAGVRRRGVGALGTTAVATVGLVLVVTWIHLGHTTTFGVPTGHTWTEARTQLGEARRLFDEVSAPAPVLPGFLLASAVMAWVIAFLADTAAFRTGAVVEAVLPAAALFVFGAALGTGQHRVVTSIVFMAAVLAYWLARRAVRQAATPIWLVADPGHGTASLLRRGAVLAAAGLVAAATIGPRLPGADADAVVAWRSSDRDRPVSRVTISPLVDIRTRLVDQSDLEVFTVASDHRSYWRVTSLERFDGRIWSSDRQYRPARGRLGADVDTSGQPVTAHQAFAITGLASIWLPAAFLPIELKGVDARYDRDSNSLLTERGTSAGLHYSVESLLPRLTPEELERATPEAPPDIVSTYLALPPGFSPAVEREAARVTRGAATPYDRARRLQDYFRSGRFTYDLAVPPGHSTSDIEAFLFRTRRGYCEQFAGTYAAMARAVGLPTRVAVGFTPGGDDGQGNYVVRGSNGHAWPEVYLEGYGWVPFEPTPGRGMPGAQAWTGVPEAQAEAGNPSSATTLPATPTTASAGAATTTTTGPGQTGATPPTTRSSHTSGSRRVLVTLAIALLLPALWVMGIMTATRWRRRRRWEAARTPENRVLLAWDEVTEALARAGVPLHRWETPSEFAARAAQFTELDATLLSGLAGAATTAAYAPDGVPGPLADRSVTAAARLEQAAEAVTTRAVRLRQLVDPRPLFPARRPHVEVSDGGDERALSSRRA